MWVYKRILIVDDSIYSREMLKSAIEKYGDYIFVDVSSGLEAINKIQVDRTKGREFDCIFLDMEMKNEDGFEILLSMRELNLRAEIVLTGALSLSDENISRGLTLGVQKFLPKPYKLNDISVICNDLGV